MENREIIQFSAKLVSDLYFMYSLNEIVNHVTFWFSQGKSKTWIKAYLLWYLVGVNTLLNDDITFCKKTLGL
jgi:hypothetical protein